MPRRARPLQILTEKRERNRERQRRHREKISHQLSLHNSSRMPSPMRQTADAIIAAFDAMDIPTILAHRSPDCQRIYLPSSMGYPPQDNAAYGRSLHQLKAIFSNFSLTVDDIVEDSHARTMCLWLRARADTAAGLYENDYVWLWEFDDTREKITRSKEYSDSVLNREFYPKLQAAMKAEKEKQAGGGGGASGDTTQESHDGEYNGGRQSGQCS